MRQINFQSDFKLIERMADGKPLSSSPFRFTYYVKASKSFVAEYNGEEYINCKPTNDGGIVVAFDNPNFGVGALMVKREFFLDDSDFNDGICDIVSVERTGIVLERGATQEYDNIDVSIFPYYQKGDAGKSAYQEWLDLGNEGSVDDFLESMRGEPLHYEDLTSEQKKDLMSNVPQYAGEEIKDITKIL